MIAQRDGARGDRRRRPAWPTASLHRQDDRPRELTCARASSCSRASACESARILLNSKSSKFPQGLANSSGTVGKYLTDSTGTSVTRLHPEDDGQRAAQRGRRRRRCISTCRGGSTTRSSISRAAITSRSAAAGACPATGSSAGSTTTRGIDGAGTADRVRRLRQAVEERLPPLLWRDGQLRRPRRDDPEREQLLRDRSERRRSVGHPGAALPLEVERLRDTSRSKHMQETFRAIIDGDGRHAAVADADAPRTATTSRAGGRIIHEIGVHADGQRPVDVGPEQQLPGARREEPLRRRRRAVRVERGQELHVDDPGAVHAHQRVHRRRAQEGERCDDLPSQPGATHRDGAVR